VAGLSFGGGFNTMREPDFCPVFYDSLLFEFIPQKNEKQAGSLV
jgi:hypothetical protein